MVYDIIIIGGGLSGLSLAILQAKQGKKVLLIEKKKYPFHRVCGEYISNESSSFLQSLDLNLEWNELPQINTFHFTDKLKNHFTEPLELGGFGISRFLLDSKLADKAKELGVDMLEDTKCLSYQKMPNNFEVKTSKGIFIGLILCASFGKYSFGNFNPSKTEQENWVGIKYHIKLQKLYPENTISIHLFEGGYCGISKVEGDKYCLCYIVKAKFIKEYNNDITILESKLLSANSELKEILAESKKINENPYVISNVHFAPNDAVKDHVVYLGDAAGTIAPLTGNGMSNALRSSYLLHQALIAHWPSTFEDKKYMDTYRQLWKSEINDRLRMGRFLHFLLIISFNFPFLMYPFMKFRWLRKWVISKTHGKIFY